MPPHSPPHAGSILGSGEDWEDECPYLAATTARRASLDSLGSQRGSLGRDERPGSEANGADGDIEMGLRRGSSPEDPAESAQQERQQPHQQEQQQQQMAMSLPYEPFAAEAASAPANPDSESEDEGAHIVAMIRRRQAQQRGALGSVSFDVGGKGAGSGDSAVAQPAAQTSSAPSPPVLPPLRLPRRPSDRSLQAGVSGRAVLPSLCQCGERID